MWLGTTRQPVPGYDDSSKRMAAESVAAGGKLPTPRTGDNHVLIREMPNVRAWGRGRGHGRGDNGAWGWAWPAPHSPLAPPVAVPHGRYGPTCVPRAGTRRP